MSKSSKQLNIPLWYKVNSHCLSYKEFLERYNDKNKVFNEQEIISLFLLAVIYGHDPYPNGHHILHTLIGERNINERALKYFYLYWVFGRNFRDENIISGNNICGTFQHMRINLPKIFSEQHIHDWLRLILSGFFGITTFFPQDISYKRRDMHILQESLRYNEQIKGPQFEINDKTEEKLYKLSKAHSDLVELKEFIQGIKFPKILHPYRDDKYFFQGIVNSYWPSILRTLTFVKPFNEEEIQYINKAHEELYNCGDIDFFIFYLEQFNKCFGSNHSLVKHLKKYLEPSNESDRIRAEQFLRNHDPIENKRYLPQLVPISDEQITQFGQTIQTEGFIKAFSPYIANNKKLILAQVEQAKCELASETIFSNQNSIYLYPIDQLFFYPDGKHMYVFLLEELSKLPDNTNPYTRQPLPSYIMEYEAPYAETESFEEIWSRVLRHEVNLQNII